MRNFEDVSEGAKNQNQIYRWKFVKFLLQRKRETRMVTYIFPLRSNVFISSVVVSSSF